MTIRQTHFGKSLLDITILPPSRLSEKTLGRMARKIERRAWKIRYNFPGGPSAMGWDMALRFAVWDLCGTPIRKVSAGLYEVSGLCPARKPSDWATAYSIVVP